MANRAADHAIKLWDLQSRQCTKILHGYMNPVISLSLSDKLLASVHKDETVKIWDAQTGKILKTLHEPAGLGSASFAPDAILRSLLTWQLLSMHQQMLKTPYLLDKSAFRLHSLLLPG